MFNRAIWQWQSATLQTQNININVQNTFLRCKLTSHYLSFVLKHQIAFLWWADFSSTVAMQKCFIHSAVSKMTCIHRRADWNWKRAHNGLKAKGQLGWNRSFVTAGTARTHMGTCWHRHKDTDYTLCVCVCVYMWGKDKVNFPANSLHETPFSRGIWEHFFHSPVIKIFPHDGLLQLYWLFSLNVRWYTLFYSDGNSTKI